MNNSRAILIEELKAKNKKNLEDHILIARKSNLPELMKEDGFYLKKSGNNQFEVFHDKNSNRIGNVFLDRKTSTWIYLPTDGRAMNPIAYVQQEKRLNFPAAVRYLDPTTPDLLTLNGGAEKFRPAQAANESARRETVASRRRRSLIKFNQESIIQHEQSGRDYCKKRGISKETIDYAMKHKVIGFGVSNFEYDIKNNLAGIRFMGFDSDGNLRNAETRLLTDKRIAKTERGSDKSFCPVIPGNEKLVHIVEGGFDGLALVDLCKRHKLEQPTIVITSGGANKIFIGNEKIKPILARAEKIVIWAENEKSDDPVHQTKKQTETDKRHCDQRQTMIEAGITADIKINKPRGQYKDLAEKNLNELRQEQAVKVKPEQESELALSM